METLHKHRRVIYNQIGLKYAPSINQSGNHWPGSVMIKDRRDLPRAVQSMDPMKGTAPSNLVVSFFVPDRRANSRRDVRPQPWEGVQDKK